LYTKCKGAAQIIVLCAISILSNFLVDVLHIPLPGSIIGILILFLLLQSKMIRVEWIELGANFLLAELLLFFIPSVVGVVRYSDLLRTEGVHLLIIIVLSTIIVMTCAGVSAKKILYIRSQK